MLLSKRIKAIDIGTAEQSSITSGSFLRVIKLSTGRLIGLGDYTQNGYSRSGGYQPTNISTTYQIGIWYSDNNGDTWIQSNKTDGRFINAIELSNGDILALGYITSTTLVQGANGEYTCSSTCISYDKGEHWQAITTDWKYDSVVETASGNIILASSYASGRHQSGSSSYSTYYPQVRYINVNNIRISTSTTAATGLGSNGRHIVGLDTVTGYVYVCDVANDKLYVSTTEGVTFTEVQNSGLPNDLSQVRLITIGNNFFIIGSSNRCYRLNRANNTFELLTFKHYLTGAACSIMQSRDLIFPYDNGYILPLTNKMYAYTEDGESFEYIISNRASLASILTISNNKIIKNAPSTDSTSGSYVTVYYHGITKTSITQLPDIVYDAKYKYLDQAGLQEIHNQIMDYISEVTQ